MINVSQQLTSVFIAFKIYIQNNLVLFLMKNQLLKWVIYVLFFISIFIYTVLCMRSYLSLPLTRLDLTQGLFYSGDLGVGRARAETSQY